MSDDFLRRWSRRKLAAKSATARAPEAPPPVAPPPLAAPADELAPTPPAESLPPVESLTPESDFTPFMKSEVDPATRRQALKALFQDPRFNVMDGLDVYIDDYSKPDPLPADWLGKMNQLTHLGDRAERDRAEAAAAAAAAREVEGVEIPIEKQDVAEAPAPVSSDTPDAVSSPSQLKES